MWPLIHLLRCSGFFFPSFYKVGFPKPMFSQRCMDSWSVLSMCTALYLCATFQTSRDVISVHYGYLTPWISLFSFGKTAYLWLVPVRIAISGCLQCWPFLFICHQDGSCFHKVCLHSTPKQFHLLQQQTFWLSWHFLPEELLGWWNWLRSRGDGKSLSLKCHRSLCS